jgi:hypothetical protein
MAAKVAGQTAMGLAAGFPSSKSGVPSIKWPQKNCQRDKIWPELVGENKARAA